MDFRGSQNTALTRRGSGGIAVKFYRKGNRIHVFEGQNYLGMIRSPGRWRIPIGYR